MHLFVLGRSSGQECDVLWSSLFCNLYARPNSVFNSYRQKLYISGHKLIGLLDMTRFNKTTYVLNQTRPGHKKQDYKKKDASVRHRFYPSVYLCRYLCTRLKTVCNTVQYNTRQRTHSVPLVCSSVSHTLNHFSVALCVFELHEGKVGPLQNQPVKRETLFSAQPRSPNFHTLWAVSLVWLFHVWRRFSQAVSP